MFALKYSGNFIPLRASLIVGRCPSCDIVFSNDRVSRRHARFVLMDGVVLEDLASANGVFVNGKRVTGPTRLEVGDQILVGDVVLELTTMEEQHDDHERRVTSIGVPPGAAPSPAASEEAEDVPDSTMPGNSTQQGDAIGMLGSVADKMLAQGQVVDAERLLSVRMSNLMEEAEAGRPIAEPVVISATEYTLKLARASRRPSWIALLFRMYEKLRRPMPLAAIDQLHDLVRITPGVRVEPLVQYLEALGSRRDGLSPTERFALQRLEGLRELIASR